jgi:hypothetical protein
MKRIAAPLLLLALSSCTFTIEPTSTPHRAASHHSKHPASSKSKTTLVDSQWIGRYKALETKFNYGIPQDEEIKAEGGQFRVPKEVVDHFMDMARAPTAVATPAGTPPEVKQP